LVMRSILRETLGSSPLYGRMRQMQRVLVTEGPAVLLRRMVRRLARRVESAAVADLPVQKVDLLAPDDEEGVAPCARVVADNTPLAINWVLTPPSRGSGGHTTILRLIHLLEQRGHHNRIYIYDRYMGDIGKHASTIRQLFPEVRAAIRDATECMAPCDAIFATAWPTAYRVRNAGVSGKRFYLVQDFEPAFYPAGTESVLAEATYGFGFRGVTIGPWLARKLSDDYGMHCDHVEFGCDTDRYFVTNVERRPCVAFYARPRVHRRGFQLGVLALELFSKRHPDAEIHVFGEAVGKLPFAYTGHGVISPDELNALYNRCAAGLSLSLTNISLIPLELLGAGCIPIVNDAPHNRSAISNPYIRYAPAAPRSLAEAVAEVISEPNLDKRAEEAAASVRTSTWEQAGETLERVLWHDLRSSPAYSGS
jgi:glycosyltransferase involved in cell wall biosynthesis